VTWTAGTQLSENVTFDVYSWGRPSRWFGSFSAVTVPVRFAVGTVVDIFWNAARAVSGLPASVPGLAGSWASVVEFEGALPPHAVRESRRATTDAVVKVRCMPEMLTFTEAWWVRVAEL
jgi:hypothetical protein